MYQACGNKILIKQLDKEVRRETGSGIVIPDTSADVIKWAEVKSLGSKAKKELPEIEAGNTILFQDIPGDEYDGMRLIEIGQVFAKCANPDELEYVKE